MQEFDYLKYLENLQIVIQKILAVYDIDFNITLNHVYGFLAITLLAIVLSVYILYTILFSSKSETVSQEIDIEEIKEKVAPEQAPDVESPKVEIAWTSRLKKGLSESRKGVWGKLASIVGPKGLDEETMDQIEELLYSADIGGAIVSELIEKMEEAFKKGEMETKDFTQFLKDFIKSKMQSVQETVDRDLYHFYKNSEHKTKVIMIVGVNGAGKTTTIGKLATKLTGEGAKVVVGACDTFRAAAVDQLAVWCDRAGAQMVRAKEGANPSGVGYDALQMAIKEKADYCILDTAGRLHTKSNLMNELTKSKNVLKKLDSNAPHQTLLVIDAITGQNAIRQAEEFNKALSLTGLIFTKCDGSSKAGSAIGIVDQLKVPITYIGVGEDVKDLDIFNLDEYLNALLDS